MSISENITNLKKELPNHVCLVAVSKTKPIPNIMEAYHAGHRIFGENKIQEAESKWIGVKQQFSNLQLHMVGKLQTNKVKKAVKIFDYIHSLENAKLALKIFQHEKELNKKIKLFIQVNLADENQKSGILLNDLNNFYNYCTKYNNYV